MILSFIKQTRRGVALPTIGVGEGLHELGRIRGCQRNLAASLPLFIIRNEAVDAPTVITAIKVEVLFDFVGYAPRMLDHFAVHVANIQTAIRGIGEINDANPRVIARRKFITLFIRWASANETDAVGVDFFSMHELSPRIPRERIIYKICPVGIATINCRARGAREIAAHSSATFHHAFDDSSDAPASANDAPGFVGTQAENFGRPAIGRDTLMRGRHGVERIPLGKFFVIDPRLEMVRVRAAKFAAVVVEAHPVLGAAAFEAEFVRVGIKPEIASAQFLGWQVGAF